MTFRTRIVTGEYIARWGLSTRARGVLINNYLGQFVDTLRKDFEGANKVNLPNCGKRTLAEISKAVAIDPPDESFDEVHRDDLIARIKRQSERIAYLEYSLRVRCDQLDQALKREES